MGEIKAQRFSGRSDSSQIIGRKEQGLGERGVSVHSLSGVVAKR